MLNSMIALQTSGGASSAAPQADLTKAKEEMKEEAKGGDDTVLQDGAESSEQEPPAKKAKTEVALIHPDQHLNIRHLSEGFLLAGRCTCDVDTSSAQYITVSAGLSSGRIADVCKEMIPL